MSIQVHLPSFEGPLGLLLYLIRKEEMDIYDIRIHEITHQYLEYIKMMREFDLEVAGEFIAMAATLIQIKSRMLLPQYNDEGEVIEEDPRQELVQKLVEYQKFKEVSGRLYGRPLLGRDQWARGVNEKSMVETGEADLEEVGLFALISVYRACVKKVRTNMHRVLHKGKSIAERIYELRESFQVGERVSFGQLMASTPSTAYRNDMVITFMSLLELARLGFVSLFQSEAWADIHIETKRPIEGEVISQVEEFEYKQSEALNAAPMEPVTDVEPASDAEIEAADQLPLIPQTT